MTWDLVLLYHFLLVKEIPFLLPEMDFLEQGENSWPSPAVATSSERTCAIRGVKASRWMCVCVCVCGDVCVVFMCELLLAH